MKLDPEVLEENRKMAVGILCCSLLMAVGFVIARRFDLSVLLGLIVGFLLAAGNFFFMSVGITRALATGDEAAAKAKKYAIIGAVIAGVGIAAYLIFLFVFIYVMNKH